MQGLTIGFNRNDWRCDTKTGKRDVASDPIQNPLIKCQVPLTSVDFESRWYVFLKQISIPFNKALLTCLKLCVVHEHLFMAGGVDHLLRTATRSGSAKFPLKSKGHFLLLLSSLETVASPSPMRYQWETSTILLDILCWSPKILGKGKPGQWKRYGARHSCHGEGLCTGVSWLFLHNTTHFAPLWRGDPFAPVSPTSNLLLSSVWGTSSPAHRTPESASQWKITKKLK